VQIRSKVAKGIAVAGLTAGVLAGSVATAQFLTYSDFFANGGKIDRLLPIETSDGVVTGPLLYGESGDVRVRLHNPNRKPVLVKLNNSDVASSAVEITSGPASCKSEVVLEGMRADGTIAYTEAFRGTLEPGQTKTITAEDWVTIKEDAPSNCQGAEFRVKFRATVEGGDYR
jgi:hypothetical protein